MFKTRNAIPARPPTFTAAFVPKKEKKKSRDQDAFGT